MTEQEKTTLKRLAAEMLRQQGMPPFCIADWGLPKTTPLNARKQIAEASYTAHEQCRDWAKRIVELVDRDR